MGSSASKALQWAFQSNYSDPKHKGIWHPFLACFFGITSSVLLADKINKFLEKSFPNINKPEIDEQKRKKYALFFLLYLVVMIVTRLKLTGSVAFYEMLWACNMAIVMVINGLLKNKSTMVGMGLIIVSIDQMMWYVDLLAYGLFNQFPIGVAKYITWPETPQLRLLTSTHHVWFMPLLVNLLRKTDGLSLQTFLFSSLMTMLWTCLGRLAPQDIPSGIAGVPDIYMNVNLSYEVWQDIQFNFLSAFDNDVFYQSMPYSNFVWNTGNFVFFWIIKLVIDKLKIKQIKLKK